MANQIIVRDVLYQLPNATGNFTITDTGGPAGLTPKACRIVLVGATALETDTGHARIAVGLTDGTDAIALSWMAEDNVVDTVGDTGRRRANNKILNLSATTNEALGVGATFVSVGTNALTINVDTASTLRGFVRFFYGANLGAKVTTVSSSASDGGTATTSSLGLTADAVVTMSGRNTWSTDAGLNNAYVSLGFAGRLPSSTQACLGLAAGDRNSPTSVGMLPRNNRLLTIINSTAGTIAQVCSVELTTWGADTLTFTTRADGGTAEAIGIGILALSLNGEKCVADCPVLDSNASGVHSYAGAGFRARALMLIGQAGATVNTIDSTVGAMSLGVASLSTPGVTLAAKWNDKDGQSTTVASCALRTGELLHVEGQWTATLVGLTNTGFDYNTGVTSAAALPTVVFSLGEEPFSASGGITVAEAVLSGVAAEKFAATGALVVNEATLAGAALEKFAATGALVANEAVLSGAALERFAATGTLLVGDIVLSGTALERFTAAGGIQAAAAQIAGAALERFAATGTLQIGPTVLSGAVLERFAATGQFTVPAAVLSGSATTAAAVAEIVDLIVLEAGRMVLRALLAGRDAERVLLADRDAERVLLADRDERRDLASGRRIVYDLDGGN